ncbi:sce7725 family protein [Natranaerobius trueperi]|uniref:Sce7725 family protein n=1 Tax=Natranaerobius trueperi TaxID=759412 RepID=A0A226BUP9_9FIRM|nr:sce7725 family protein [Natranaerobius trueperi]OWZ82726.1 hypothetical protein CDO51_12510 [Natranaerobius trueperi]
MYLPYLRGRQFELIALRELLEKDLLHDKIIPIVEPVKLTSSLNKTLSTYTEKATEIAVIHNPKVGSFHPSEGNRLTDNYYSIILNDNIIKTHIVNSASEDELNELVNNYNIDVSDIITVNSDPDHISTYNNVFSDETPRLNLIPDERTFRRQIRENKVILDDKLNKQPRNVDYTRNVDEFFSDDHLFYNEDGYDGFSDFSIVGKEYSESGFAPHAVVVHITYFDDDWNLRIYHFVSDSNEDFRDPAGKFYEALKKLTNWKSDKDISTFGLEEFEKHYQEGTYPGLGVVKKLSIMHHIELVGQFFEENNL